MRGRDKMGSGSLTDRTMPAQDLPADLSRREAQPGKFFEGG